MNFEKLLNQFKTLAEKHLGDPPDPNAAQDGHADTTSTESNDDLDTKSKDRVKQVIRDFQSITPLIEKAGYQITDLQIELGIIPKLIPHFLKVHEVDEIQKAEIIAQLQNKRLMKLLLQALFKADSFQQNLKMTQYAFKGIEVEIAPLPAVRLNYQHLAGQEKKSQEIATGS